MKKRGHILVIVFVTLVVKFHKYHIILIKCLILSLAFQLKKYIFFLNKAYNFQSRYISCSPETSILD